MTIGRSHSCACGSGKKYKHCCLDFAQQKASQIHNDVADVFAKNPHLTTNELNVVMEHKVMESNNRPVADFCGLSPAQMFNWFYAPLNQVKLVDLKLGGPRFEPH